MTQNTALDFDEQPAVEGMKYVAGGVFTMGSDNFYPEESPSRKVSVDPFLIDEAPVTNANFAKFVAATGHITFAEIAPNSADYPGMPPEMAAIRGNGGPSRSARIGDILWAKGAT